MFIVPLKFAAFKRGEDDAHVMKLSCEARCPECGALMKFHQEQSRKVTYEQETYELLVPTYHCPVCDAYHRALPEGLLPYKRYPAQTVENGLMGTGDQDAWDDDATPRGWAKWLRVFISRIEDAMNSKLRAVFALLRDTVVFPILPLGGRQSHGWLKCLSDAVLQADPRYLIG